MYIMFGDVFKQINDIAMVCIGFAFFSSHGILRHFNNFRNGVGHTGNPALIQTSFDAGIVYFGNDCYTVGNFIPFVMITRGASGLERNNPTG